jgi:hypothetical protein
MIRAPVIFARFEADRAIDFCEAAVLLSCDVAILRTHYAFVPHE